ncbi:alpha/beta hydrolase fold domain-containing protein [Prosthecobacter sp.]|uniref:alpha/beta hydrolase fold domain-containing protein n=1 Tax=Prosthecobacter sp. TaxID=1965333 RepID=UPI003783A5CE
MKSALRLFTCLLLLASVSLHAETKAPAVVIPTHTRQNDVVYGRKFGFALTLDVITPEKPNGYGIVYMVSGGWVSGYSANTPPFYAPFLERGYTVFSVRHACQPKFIIPEITQDIHRAVRFIRHNAAKFNVNPDKLGISGGSAGGHLSLTMAVHGGPGDPQAKDAIDRESSAIQAVACLYPPTDFLNYGKPGEDAVGVGTLKNYKGAFGAEADTPEGRQRLGREVSPIYYVTAKLPPTFIIHGDQDFLVPIQQSETFVAKAKEAGATAQLVVKPGAAHGWTDRQPDYAQFAEWFDVYLRGLKK